MDKITPDTYKKMNEEFIEEGTPLRLNIPTQEEIDKWQANKVDFHTRTVEPVDMVAEMWKEHNRVKEDQEEQERLRLKLQSKNRL